MVAPGCAAMMVSDSICHVAGHENLLARAEPTITTIGRRRLAIGTVDGLWFAAGLPNTEIIKDWAL
jgi:hypothetical protein